MLTTTLITYCTIHYHQAHKHLVLMQYHIQMHAASILMLTILLIAFNARVYIYIYCTWIHKSAIHISMETSSLVQLEAKYTFVDIKYQLN